MFRKTILFTLLSLVLSPDIYSQGADSLIIKGKFYYQNGEFSSAIKVLSQGIAMEPDNYEAYKIRANSYSETGEFFKAVNDLTFILNNNAENASACYSLANVYDKMGSADSCIYFLKNFIRFRPELAIGYSRLSLAFMEYYPLMGDSAVFYAGKAVQKDPGDPSNINNLAMAYYTSGKYKSALETAMLGIKSDSSYYLLYQSAGIASFYSEDYKSSILFFDKAADLNPGDLVLLDYKLQAILMANTPSENLIQKKEGGFLMKDVSSENSKKILTQTSDPQNEFYYKKLERQFQTKPLSFSLNDFFMFYLGYTRQKNYSPYSKKPVNITQGQDMQKSAKILEDALYLNPVDFPLYLELANLYLDMKNMEKYLENRFKYIGFTESIAASGDGNSTSSAYIINDVSHENTILNKLGLGVRKQSLIKEKNHYYDELSVISTSNQEGTVYFDISIPFQTLPDKIKKSAGKKSR